MCRVGLGRVGNQDMVGCVSLGWVECNTTLPNTTQETYPTALSPPRHPSMGRVGTGQWLDRIDSIVRLGR